MELERLIERYISAYNRRDVDGVLALMHEGAALYDAFWRESCVGRDLTQYLHDAFDDDTYWYEQVGGVMETDNGAVFRYRAHERTESKPGRVMYSGAEVLTILNNKILTVSDFYCDPDDNNLIEVAELAVTRHGISNFTKSGLSAMKSFRIRRQISERISQGRLNRNSTLTASQLADQIGCSSDHLLLAMNIESEAEFHHFLDQYRAKRA